MAHFSNNTVQEMESQELSKTISRVLSNYDYDTSTKLTVATDKVGVADIVADNHINHVNSSSACDVILEKSGVCLKDEDGGFRSVQDIMTDIFQLWDKNKEDKQNMIGFNFNNFGACDDDIRMSAYGLAVKNASGTWVSYDKENNAIMDVEVFNFEAKGLFFKIPIGLAQVKMGDVLIHHPGEPVFVTAINTDTGTFTVVDPVMGDVKDILPTKSPFGFNFVTKIVSLFDTMNMGKMAPNADNPFGGMGMYMIMSSVLNKDSDSKTTDNIKTMLPILLMTSMAPDNADNGNVMNNPLMWMLMLK